MYALRIADLFPAIVAIAFYSVVFFVAELGRRATDFFIPKKNSLLYTFMIELIATMQMCTCVFENGIMIKHYGVGGFLFTVLGLLLLGGVFNRGAYVSPLVPIELWMKREVSTEKLFALLLAQAAGGFMAFRCAQGLWFYSLQYSADHLEMLRNLPCAFVYRVPFPYVMLYEIGACFVLRFLLFRMPSAYKHCIAPALFAGALSIALALIGVPGLNPVTVSSRLQGCPGLDTQWFIIIYWCCPVVGWLLASRLDSAATVRPEKEKEKGGSAVMANGSATKAKTARGLSKKKAKKE